MSSKDISKKTVYVKQDPISHILNRPDMYVGSKRFEKQNTYIFRDGKIIRTDIETSPALVRTFIEILSNAIDNIERSKDVKMSFISIKLDSTSCEIKNDGAIIPIEKNNDIYNHSLIFGHLLSGSNYDDEEIRFTSGRNGLGAKLTNVLSNSFTVEGTDPINKSKLVQTWTNNMKETNGPKITKYSKKSGYTSIKWEWDCKWFGIKNLSQDILDLFAMHTLNASFVTGLKVTLNEEKLPNALPTYFNLMGYESSELLKLENEHSKVFVIPSHEFEAISFVNGIQTKNGGKHVNAWVEAVCRPVLEKLNKKGNTLTIKDVKIFFKFLIVTRIPNPEFESQEKNELKTNVKVEFISPSQVNKIMKWTIGEQLKNLVSSKEKKIAIKTITNSSHPVIEGYDKANNAGKKGKECTLIICEGLSAKTFAVEGISKGLNGKKGRDWFGIYPLRGKLLNTRNTTPSIIKNNTVITNLIKILGLDYGKPDKLDKLNYGKICIITDADVDGIHIEGLILNFFHSLFPILLKNNFITSMKTPILRIDKTYYFDERSTVKQNSRSQIKYHKGLGTIKKEEVKKVFGIKMLDFQEDETSDQYFDIAFDKKESSERKNWIANYNKNSDKPTLDDEKEEIIKFNLSRHLNEELIKFFIDDCKRSLPNAIDGLKESQRKIIYAAKKRNLKSEIKVAQFGAYVAEHTNYHHGEENLFKTIIKMAQSFPGSNNLPLFTEEGMFGTRLEGGEDAASPRYIFTKTCSDFEQIFNPFDDKLFKQRIDDGDVVEPYYYVPLLPLLIINGSIGIGTGWMCNVPQFNPKDVIQACKFWMSGDKKEFLKFVENMKPWYKGFIGEVEKISETKFLTKGIFKMNKNVVHVTELPIGLWNSKFQKMLDEKQITYKNKSTPDLIDYEIEMNSKFDLKDFEKKMQTGLNLDNIVVFDKDENIIKVSLIELFELWGKSRLEFNTKRKNFLLKELKEKIRIAECKHKFIQAVREKKIELTWPEEKILNFISSEITKDDSKFLLDLPVKTFTEEKRKQLEKLMEKTLEEIKILEKKTEKEIWFDDMEELDID